MSIFVCIVQYDNKIKASNAFYTNMASIFLVHIEVKIFVALHHFQMFQSTEFHAFIIFSLLEKWCTLGRQDFIVL